MKEHPILFSAPMVRAILEGRKTQTRRVCKNKVYANGLGFNGHDFNCHNDYLPPSALLMDYREGGYDSTTSDLEGWGEACPYGQPGDRLWVRETHAIVPRTAYAMSDGVQQTLRPDDNHDAAIYREGWERSTGGFRWRPSIHMPRWASRILLEVVSVRVERLQDISEADAEAEGAPLELGVLERVTLGAKARYRSGFCRLWSSINGRESWDANPWVWVVEFRRVAP